MISVILPAYNCEKFLAEAIQSILNQTYDSFELIIVDDGSTDRTLEIARLYGEKDNRVRVLSQKNMGVSAALNRGIQEARYDWIAIMHADDIALPHRLERQIQASRENPKVVAWGAYAYHINEKGKILGLSKVGATSEEEFYKMMHNGELIHLIHPTAFMMRKAIMRVGGYNSAFDGSEELELFHRLSDLGPILAIPEPLICYRIHASSVTMRKFFKIRTFTRYVRARQRAKAEGKEPPSWEEFIREYQGAPLLKRLRRQIDDLSQFYYRRFAVAVSSEKYFQAICFFALSAVCNPMYALPRAWRQRFSKEARTVLQSIKKSMVG